MNFHIRTLLLTIMLGAASAMAQQVPKALEQGPSKNVIINSSGGNFSVGFGIGIGIVPIMSPSPSVTGRGC